MALVTNIPITSATVDNMSRNDYLLWVNECLQSEFAKLEQLHTGAGYCLFTEILFPGTINLKRVKYNSRLELDWLSNWKIVQTAWKQLGIEKIVPVEKLIKGKFQDNFEFLQWFKKFFDANYDGHEYNPAEMRNFEELPKENKLKSSQQLKTRTVPIPQRTGSNQSINNTLNKKPPISGVASVTTATRKPHGSAARQTTQSVQSKVLSQQPQNQHQQRQHTTPSPDLHLIEEIKQKDQQLEELRNQLAETDDVVNGLEKERDFYFAKLRKIEVLCQENEATGTLNSDDVLQILYETEEGFAAPDEIPQNNGDIPYNNGNSAIDAK